MFPPAGKWYIPLSRARLFSLFYSADLAKTTWRQRWPREQKKKKKKNEFTNESWSGKFRVRKVAFMPFSLLSCSLFMLSLLNVPKVWWKLPSFDDRLTVISTFNYFSRFCPVDYIRHTHHAFIIHYYFRVKTQRLLLYCLLWLCTLPFPLSPPRLLFQMICFYFCLPASSNPTLSRVCIFHPEEAVSFSQPYITYIGEWAGSL